MDNEKTESLPSIEVFEEFFSDVSSTRYHLDIIHASLEVAKQIDEVEGVLLKGSLGKDEGDIFSDIDFHILHAGKIELSNIIKKAFMDRLSDVGEVIQFFPSTAFAEDQIIYFYPFVKFELSVGTIKDALTKWRIGRARILYDKNGKIHKLVEATKEIPFEFNEVLPIIKGRAVAIPAFTYITAGFIVRGEIISAIEAVDWIAKEMLRISGWLIGIRDEGPRRAEQRFPQEILDYFAKTRTKNGIEIWDALDVILDWYDFWMVEKFNEHNIVHSAHQVERMREVLELLRSKV